jgi:hypothetical protein
VLAWARFGDGKMSEALKDFEAVAGMRGMEAVGLYHKALALAVAGDFEGAEKILSGEAAGPINLNRRGIVARVQILSQLERNADALALLDKSFGTESEPMLDSPAQPADGGRTPALRHRARRQAPAWPRRSLPSAPCCRANPIRPMCCCTAASPTCWTRPMPRPCC